MQEWVNDPIILGNDHVLRVRRRLQVVATRSSIHSPCALFGEGSPTDSRSSRKKPAPSNLSTGLGPPVVPTLSHPFFGGGQAPTKIDYRKEIGQQLILTSLLQDA